MAKKGQFMTKTTSFGGKKVVLYSIDGLIWSTRKEELAIIKHRLDTQKVTLDLAPKEEEGKDSTESKQEETQQEDELELAPIEIKEDSKGKQVKQISKPNTSAKKAPALPSKNIKKGKVARAVVAKGKKGSKKRAA
jgi:hypothetical protein